MQSTYLSAAETAKLLRKQLKLKFPGIKFSVRSKTYSLGASIDISWTDGPTTNQVEPVTNPFAGAGFDGMIDLKYHSTSWLMPDGSVSFASTDGTEGSMGMVPANREWMPDPDAKLVSFGADYVFCHRNYSPDFYRRAALRAAEKHGVDPDTLEFSRPNDYDGSIYSTNARNIRVDEHSNKWLDGTINAELSRRTNYVASP